MFDGRTPRMSYIIRIIAGAYIAYLGYKIMKPGIRGETEGFSPAVAITIGVLFAIIGIIFFVNGLRGYMYLKQHPELEAEQEEEETSEQEDGAEPQDVTDPEESTADEPAALETSGQSGQAEAPKGLLQRASIPEHLRVTEDEEVAADEEETAESVPSDGEETSEKE